MFEFEMAEYRARLDALRAQMAAEGLDALIAYSNAKIQANVRYLTSYYTRFAGAQWTPEGYYTAGACAVLILPHGDPILRTDLPWDIVRAKSMSVFDDTEYSDGLGRDLGAIAARAGATRIGIDSWSIFPARDYLALVEAVPGAEIVGSEALAQVRRVKSPAELALLERAEQIADIAVQAGMNAVRVGGTEYEAALVAEMTLRELGDMETGGGSIISAGPNSSTGSSLPERDRKIKAGEWVLFDVLPRFGGYCGDIARMRLAGDESDLEPRLRHLHAATVLINREVIGLIKPGVTPSELNERAIAVATAEGVAQYKIPLVGHGVGLDIHDRPDYYWDDTPLKVGEVFTVEPCLLIDGVAGTRIEDVVVVTETGVRVLSDTPRGLTPA
ncbi:MAG: Xaa-Pro peptidase family protein [Actinomycetes bacterium]|jgi:Xaa-Pro aminopeptidase